MNESRHQGVRVEDTCRTERLQQAMQFSYPGLQVSERVYERLSFDGAHRLGNVSGLSV